MLFYLFSLFCFSTAAVVELTDDSFADLQGFYFS